MMYPTLRDLARIVPVLLALICMPQAQAQTPGTFGAGSTISSSAVNADFGSKLDANKVLTSSTTWTVCASGCNYPDPLSAFSAARGFTAFSPFAYLQINISDGAYNIAGSFYTEENMSNVFLTGDCSNSAAVTLNFTNIVDNNGNAVAALNGGKIGHPGQPGFDCMTLNGVGARTSRSVWVDQSFGAGAFASGSGSNITFGPKMRVANFYYSALAENGGHFIGDGGSYSNAGDVNVFAKFGGTALCRGCTIATASHIFTDGFGQTQSLGYNALAEGSAFLDVSNSTATDAQDACFAAHTNGAVWAHQGVATNCNWGIAAGQSGMIEAAHAHISASNLGAYADTGGRMNLDSAELNNNTFDGVQLNGGSATGTAVNAHNNGGYGIKVIKQARGEFYGTLSLLLSNTNGAYFVEQATGCTSTTAPCAPASTLIVN